MADVELSTLLPHIIPYVPGCPENFIKQKLYEMARLFCKETNIFLDTLDDIATVADQASYTLERTWDTDIERVTEVLREDTIVQESQYTVSPGGVITFDPAPTIADDVLSITVVLRPRLAMSLYPERMVNRWSSAFVAGTLYTLLNMKRQWRDEVNSRLNFQLFEQEIVTARSEFVVERRSQNILVEIPLI